MFFDDFCFSEHTTWCRNDRWTSIKLTSRQPDDFPFSACAEDIDKNIMDGLEQKAFWNCEVGCFFLVDFSNCNVESCCMLHLSGHQARCSFWRRCHCSGGVCQSIGRGWKMVEMVVMVMRFASRRCQTCTWIVGNDAFFFSEAPKKKRRKMPAGEGPLFQWDGGSTTLPFWRGKHDGLGERIWSW